MHSFIYTLWLAGLAAPVFASNGTRSSAAPSVTADSLGATYLGCYQDTSDRALNGPWTDSGTNTIETCHKYCAGQGYDLFGLQESSQCFCGNEICSGDHDLVEQSQCEKPCSGDSSQICGSCWRLSVYRISSSSSSSSAHTSTSSKQPSSSSIGISSFSKESSSSVKPSSSSKESSSSITISTSSGRS